MMEPQVILIIVSFLLGISGVIGKTRVEDVKGLKAVTFTGYFVIVCLLASLYFGFEVMNDEKFAQKESIENKEKEKKDLQNKFDEQKKSSKKEILLLKKQLDTAINISNALVVSGLKVKKGLWIDIKPNKKYEKYVPSLSGKQIISFSSLSTFLDAIIPPELNMIPIRFHACMGNLCIAGEFPNGIGKGRSQLYSYDEKGNKIGSHKVIPHINTEDGWLGMGNIYSDQYSEVSPFFRNASCSLTIELNYHLNSKEIEEFKDFIVNNVDHIRIRTGNDSGKLFDVRAELELKYFRSEKPNPASPDSYSERVNENETPRSIN